MVYITPTIALNRLFLVDRTLIKSYELWGYLNNDAGWSSDSLALPYNIKSMTKISILYNLVLTTKPSIVVIFFPSGNKDFCANTFKPLYDLGLFDNLSKLYLMSIDILNDPYWIKIVNPKLKTIVTKPFYIYELNDNSGSMYEISNLSVKIPLSTIKSDIGITTNYLPYINSSSFTMLSNVNREVHEAYNYNKTIIYNDNSTQTEYYYTYKNSYTEKNNIISSVGMNNFGKLGTGDNLSRTTFYDILDYNNIKGISNGYNHYMIITNDNYILSCGDNNNKLLNIENIQYNKIVHPEIPARYIYRVYNYKTSQDTPNSYPANMAEVVKLIKIEPLSFDNTSITYKNQLDLVNLLNTPNNGISKVYDIVLKATTPIQNSWTEYIPYTNTDGEIYNKFLYSKIPNNNNNIIDVCSGNGFSIILYDDGTVYGAGDNYYCQLGKKQINSQGEVINYISTFSKINTTISSNYYDLDGVTLIKIINTDFFVTDIACGSNFTIYLANKNVICISGLFYDTYGTQTMYNDFTYVDLYWTGWVQLIYYGYIMNIYAGTDFCLMLLFSGDIFVLGKIGFSSITALRKIDLPLFHDTSEYVSKYPEDNGKIFKKDYYYTITPKYISCGNNIVYILLKDDTLHYLDYTNKLTKVEIPANIKIDKIWCQNDSNDVIILTYDKQIYCKCYISYNMGLCTLDKIDTFINITPSTRKSFYKTLDDGITNDNIITTLSITTK